MYLECLNTDSTDPKEERIMRIDINCEVSEETVHKKCHPCELSCRSVPIHDDGNWQNDSYGH